MADRTPPDASNDSRYDDLEEAFLASRNKPTARQSDVPRGNDFVVIRYAAPAKVDGAWRRGEEVVGRYANIEKAVEEYIGVDEGALRGPQGDLLAHRGIVEERGAFVGSEQFLTKEIEDLVRKAKTARAVARAEHGRANRVEPGHESGEPQNPSPPTAVPERPELVHAQHPEPIELHGAAEYAAYPLAGIFGAAVAAAKAPFIAIARVTQARVDLWRRTSAARAYEGVAEANREIGQRLVAIHAHPKTKEYQQETESAIASGDRQREREAFRHFRNYLSADVPFDKDGSNLRLKKNLATVFQLARRLEWQMTTALKRARAIGRDPQVLREEFTRVLDGLSDQARMLRGPDGQLLKDKFARFGKVIARFVEKLFSSLRADSKADAAPRM